MSSIPNMQLLFSEEEIRKAVADLAAQIRGEYAGKDLVIVGVLKGCFIFLADLVRALEMPAEIDFIWLSAYGRKRYTSGEVRIKKDLEASIAGRHVLIVDDIVDTGITLRFLADHLAQRNPASTRICVLVDKPEYRMTTLEPDYVGFEVEKGFVVGYGLDDREMHRHLREIGILPERAEAAEEA